MASFTSPAAEVGFTQMDSGSSDRKEEMRNLHTQVPWRFTACQMEFWQSDVLRVCVCVLWACVCVILGGLLQHFLKETALILTLFIHLSLRVFLCHSFISHRNNGSQLVGFSEAFGTDPGSGWSG